ncbi:hypothetical protein N3K66_006687 [Trichothecium roseum]|uniref:Uncharacterized protein n=1 Tax=Trichothecium roseum TaxID=47278 RepID=A0ACC0UW20_9HYPO|nr:hypothetical protein N3K66_006687 [Trichothecium roseum]
MAAREPTPPPPPALEPAPSVADTMAVLPPRNPFIHNAAIAGAIVCPLAMALPPRRLDLRLLVLAGGFSLSTNQLAYAYTGRSIFSRFSSRAASALDVAPLPESALRTQRLLREQKEARDRDQQQQQQQQRDKTNGDSDGDKGSIAKMAETVWMGGEGKDWQAKRAAEHARSFEEGKGMGDIIIDQIRDVWGGNWKPSSEKVSDEELRRRELREAEEAEEAAKGIKK